MPHHLEFSVCFPVISHPSSCVDCSGNGFQFPAVMYRTACFGKWLRRVQGFIERELFISRNLLLARSRAIYCGLISIVSIIKGLIDL